MKTFFVITGGPGSGKTTLIDALEEAGFARTVEAGRGVIQDQVAIDGPRCRGAIRPPRRADARMGDVVLPHGAAGGTGVLRPAVSIGSSRPIPLG